MSEKIELIKIKFTEDEDKRKMIEIIIFGNKLFEIEFKDTFFADNKEFVFKEKLPTPAKMILNQFMKGGLK